MYCSDAKQSIKNCRNLYYIYTLVSFILFYYTIRKTVLVEIHRRIIFFNAYHICECVVYNTFYYYNTLIYIYYCVLYIVYTHYYILYTLCIFFVQLKLEEMNGQDYLISTKTIY